MKSFVAGLAALLFIATPGAAQTIDEVNRQIDMLQGNSAQFVEAFDAIQAAVADGDADALAQWASYPITVTIEGPVIFHTPEAFAAAYEEIVTDEIASAVLDQAYETLFVNQYGVMFGDGQVWLGGVCLNDACDRFDVRIITIQTTQN